jgi:hypothetical protein
MFVVLIVPKERHRSFLVRFEGMKQALAPVFRTQTEHKLSAKTKTTKISPHIKSLELCPRKSVNAKMAHRENSAHQMCAQPLRARVPRTGKLG